MPLTYLLIVSNELVKSNFCAAFAKDTGKMSLMSPKTRSYAQLCTVMHQKAAVLHMLSINFAIVVHL